MLQIAIVLISVPSDLQNKAENLVKHTKKGQRNGNI